MPRVIPAMIDMKRTAAEKDEATAMPFPSGGPDYPYGLCISFDSETVEKLALDDDVQVGDMIHLHCMAKVTSVSVSDNEQSGPCCRYELQITHIAAEDEDGENDKEEAAEDKRPSRRSRLYG